MADVAILGAGSWGSALSIAIGRTGQKVQLWDRDSSLLQHIADQHTNPNYLPGCIFPEHISPMYDLAVLSTITDIIIALPSSAMVEIVGKLKHIITPKHRIVIATKGLHPETGSFFHTFLQQQLACHAIAVLAGPSFAKEVALNLPTAIVVAGNNAEHIKFLMKILHKGMLRVYPSQDIIGVELGSVVKNVLAVACGISDGLHLGANARSALITRGINEMMRLGVALGAKEATLIGLSGLGDVVLTCTDNQSRNRRFGILLAEGLTSAAAIKQIGQVVEASFNVVQLAKLAQELSIDMPIVTQVYRIINGELKTKDAVSELFARIPKEEGMANFFEID